MSGIFTKMRSLPIHYPLIRGMISYSIIWPTCSIVQEYLEHGVTIEEANFARAARFGIFGSFFMAPVFYGWMKFSGRFFRSKTLKTAVLRAAIEQVSYSPLAMVYFFYGMSLLEFKPLNVCWNEVKEKFWPTYKIGVIFWPTAQTFNFYFVSEKNRIVFVSVASFIWTIYLAHMKAKEQKNLMLDQDINVLKMSENFTRVKVVVESDSLSNKKDKPLEGATGNPGDSNKSKIDKKPETTTLSVAPKDQVVTESESNKGNISTPIILKKDQPIPMTTVPIVIPSIPDKIIPTSPNARDPVEMESHPDKMPHNTIIIENIDKSMLPIITTPIVETFNTESESKLDGNSNLMENDPHNIIDEHMLTIENTDQSIPISISTVSIETDSLNTLTIENDNTNQISTDLFEPLIEPDLSEDKAENLSILQDIALDTNITPKVDAAPIFMSKHPSGDKDKFKFDELPSEDGEITDLATVNSCPKGVTIILNDLVEIPIADEERIKFIK